MCFLSTGPSKNGVRGPESRQKPGEMCVFCLLGSPKSGLGQGADNAQHCICQNQLSFTDTSMKIGSLSVIGLLKKWSKTSFCP